MRAKKPGKKPDRKLPACRRAESIALEAVVTARGRWARVDSPIWDRLRCYIDDKVSKVLGPSLEGELTLMAGNLPPLYCSVCCRPVGWLSKAGQPGDVEVKRCGFLIVYCKGCEKQIGNPAVRLDDHVAAILGEHDTYHKVLSIEGVIRELRSRGTFTLEANA